MILFTVDHKYRRQANPQGKYDSLPHLGGGPRGPAPYGGRSDWAHDATMCMHPCARVRRAQGL